MKKFFVGLFAFAIILGLSAAVMAEVPAVGIKTWGSAAQKLGKFSYMDNGNLYRFVTNVGTLEYAGHPAVYVRNGQNDYSVSYGGVTGSGECFAGVWLSSEAGATSIDYGENGWIQVAGIADAYVRGDLSFSAAIVVGSILSPEAADLAKTAGNRYFKYMRGPITVAVPTIEATIYPRALEANTSSTSTKVRVQLRSAY